MFMKSYQGIGSLGFEHFEVKGTDCLTMCTREKVEVNYSFEGKAI